MAVGHSELRSLEDGHLYNIPTSQFTLPALTSVYLALTTQATEPVQWVSSFISSDSAALEIRVYEGETYTGGTPILPVPTNRHHSDVVCFTVFAGVVTTPVSIPMLDLPFFSKQEGVQVASEAIGFWVFDINQDYIMEIRNASNQSAVLGSRFGLSCRYDMVEGPFYQGGAD